MDEIEAEKNKYQSAKSKPCNTWFFERTGDGFVFACDEREAWDILKNRGNWMRRDFKMLGMSDGTTYFEVLKTGKQEADNLMQEKQSIQNDLKRYMATEERMVFTELKDVNDEMVVKVRGIINDLNTKIQEIDNNLANINKIIVDKAFKAELEKARGNMVMPSNQDIITPAGRREEILRNMPTR